jgi:hypothetical protein
MKTKGLNLRETLQACREHWQWLADNPNKSKGDYFRAQGIGFHDRPECGCFACQWDTENGDKSLGCVQTCPLKNIWPNGCTDYPSPYNDWLIVSNTSRVADATKHALAIVKGCDEALAALPKEGV